MFGFLKWKSKTARLSDASSDEQMAFLEVATMAICLDGHRRPHEQLEMRRFLGKIEWKFDVERRIPEIEGKAIAAIQDVDLMDAYLCDIKAKVKDKEISSAIIGVCSDITYEGGGAGDHYELTFLSRLQRLLDGAAHSNT